MNIFNIKLIKINTKYDDKDSLFIAMVENFFDENIIKDKLEFLSVLKTREEIMSTGIGFGIALPHARHKTVNELKVAVYILSEPIDFDSLDGLPVNIVFMVAIPVKSNNEYMKVLNLISKTLHEDTNRQFFNSTDDEEKILNFLKELDYET